MQHRRPGRRPISRLATTLAGAAFLAGLPAVALAARPSVALAARPSVAPAAVAAPALALALAARSEHGTSPAPWQASIEVPVLRGGTAAGTARVDAALAAMANREVAAFRHQLGDGPVPKGLPPVSTLSVRFDTSLVSSGYVAFTERSTTFDAGAAHPYDTVATITFDAPTGSRLTLASLFRPGAGYLGVLSRLTRAHLAVQYPPAALPAAMVDAGTAARAANFAGWALTPFGLEVAFGDDAVGPYVIGAPTVVLPFADLAGVARPAGPLAYAARLAHVRMPLLPATVPSSVDECYQTATATAPAAMSCADGRLNAAAWYGLGGYGDVLLGAGPAATPATVRSALCLLGATFALPTADARSWVGLVDRYYGWPFPAATALAGWPARCPPSRGLPVG